MAPIKYNNRDLNAAPMCNAMDENTICILKIYDRMHKDVYFSYFD